MSQIAKKLLFLLKPETAHNLVKKTQSFLPLKSWKASHRIHHKSLKSTWQNIDFENPIGLAAGFDKDAKLLPLSEALGFGFSELGSVTAWPCDGQKKPRIFRLKKDESLINWMGLPNPGAKKFLQNLEAQKTSLPIGINIAKTPDFVFEQSSIAAKNGIDDFLKSIQTLYQNSDYVCLNLSCPNSEDDKLFEHPDLFIDLAKAVSDFRTSQKILKPFLIKISPDLEKNLLSKTIDLALKYNFDGFVVGNTTSTRPLLKTPLTSKLKNKGGLSGKSLFTLANQQLKNVYQIVGTQKMIIGVGGVSDFETLLQKFSNGAKMVQVYTGFIYGGTTFVKNLNQKLVQFCTKHKLSHYSELIGQNLNDLI